MPQVVPFLIKVGTLVTFGAATGTAAAVIGGIAVVGTFAASRFLKPKLDMNIDDNAGTRSATVRSTTEAQKRVYGETLVSGPITYAQVSGTNNRYLHQVIALAGHELTAIDEIRFDEHILDLTNSSIYNPSTKQIISGKFGPKNNENDVSEAVVYIDTRLGAASQTAYSALRSDTLTSQEYLATHRGDGIASVYVRMTTHEGAAELWDDVGNPRNIRALVRGAKVYDPRLEVDAGGTAGANPTNASYVVYDDNSLGVGTSVNQYARDKQGQNPALIIADLLMNDDFGLGIPASKIDWSAVITAADKCDQLVVIPTSSVQKRFFASGVVFGSDSHRRSIEKILMAMDGDLLYSQGKYIIKAGVYEAPTETFTENDVVSAVQVKTATPRQDRYNQISGLFIDPNENYKLMEFGPVTVDGAYARDNSEVLPEEIKLPFTSNRYAAQRLAWKKVNQSFAQTMIQVTVNLKGMRVRVGDRINLTLTDFESIDSGNWSPKIFKVISWGFAEDGSGVDLTLIEDASSYYDDPDEDDYSTIDAQGTITTALPDVPSPSSFTATSQINSIKLDWTNPANNASWEQIWVFRNTTGTTPTDSDTPITRLRTTSFIDQRDADGTEYYYWIQAVKYPSGTTPSSGSANKQKSPMIAIGTPASGKIAATKIGQTVMGEDSVGTAQVIDGNIGSDQIATTIQSNNWHETNQTGWQINKTGDVTFNSGNFRGTVTVGGTDLTSTNTLNSNTTASDVGLGNVDNTNSQDTTQNGLISGTTITGGGITLSSGGVIKGGQTEYDDDDAAGFFLGYDSNAYKFSIGNSDNSQKLTFDGSTLTVKGTITVGSTDLTETNTLNANTTASDVGLGNVDNTDSQNTTQNGLISGTTITGGGITLSSGGVIKGGQTAFNTGTGFFLGYSTVNNVADYRFSIGDSTNSMVWDGSDLTVTGGITADSFALTSGVTAITDPNDLVGNTNNNAFFRYETTAANDAVAAPTDAQFNTAFGRDPRTRDVVVVVNTASDPDVSAAYIYNGSSWDAKNDFFTGDVIVDGTITADHLSVNSLSAISADMGSITAGSLDINSGAFSVTSSGVMSATGATVSGAITATSLTLSNTSIAKSQLATGVQSSLGLADTATQNDTAFAAKIAWGFDEGVQGWSVFTNTGTLTHNSDGYVVLDSTSTDPILFSPTLDIDGAKDFTIRARIKRTSPSSGATWQGTCYYSTSGHSSSESYRKTISDPTVLNEWVVAEWDMSNLTAGGTDWVDNTITQIRLDFGNTASDDFRIDWIAIGTKGAAPVREGGDINSGTVGGISIDSSKLYSGSTGTWQDANTGFYLDNTGKFSLKDKLFFNPSDNTLTVKGVIDADSVIVQNTLEVIGNFADRSIADGTITKEMLDPSVFQEIYESLATSVGGSNGDFKSNSGSFTASGGTVTVGTTSDKFDHGQQSVDVEAQFAHYFYSTTNYTTAQAQATLNFEVSADGSFTDLTSATKTHTLQFNEYDLSSYYGYTYLVYHLTGSVKKTFTSGSGNDLPDDTDVIFRVRVTGVGTAFTGQTVPFDLTANEGVTGVTSTGGNADTLDNLDSTAFLRSNVDDTFDANLTVAGNLDVTGNLNITGDINSYNVTDLDVTDKTITVNAGGTQALSHDAGLVIDRGTATNAAWQWDETEDKFQANYGIEVTGADWYQFGPGKMGASLGSYGMGNRANSAYRQLTFHVPNQAAYGSSGTIPSFGWYSNGAIELMKLYSDSGDLWLKGTHQIGGELQLDRGSNNWDNIIRSAGFASQGFTSSTAKHWIEYNTKGGHHFVLNRDGGAGAAENTYDHFSIWQGAIDGDQLFRLTNTGNLTLAGNLDMSAKDITDIDQIKLSRANTAGTGNDYDAINIAYRGSWSQNTNTIAGINVTDSDTLTQTIGRFGISWNGTDHGHFVVSDLYSGTYGATGVVFKVNRYGNGYFSGDLTVSNEITVGPTSGGSGSLIRATGAFSSDVTNSASNVPLVLQATGSDTTFLGALNRYGRQAFAVNINGSADSGTQRGDIDFYTKTNGSWQKALTLSQDDVTVRGGLTVDGSASTGNLTITGAFNQTTSNTVLGYLKGTNSGTSGFAEYHIRNDNDDALVIGSIGSNYTPTAWAGSRYIYSTHGELRIKAATNLRLYSGGFNHDGDLAITMDENQEVTIHKDMTLNGEFNGDLFVRNGKITVKRGTGLTTTIIEDDSSAGGRGQLLLDSHYSDMIIASRNANANKHGSTLTFATQSTGNNNYRKIVVGQGQYQEGAGILAFAYGENQTNPHNILGTDNAEAGVVMDLGLKNIGIGGGASKDPITRVHVSGGRIAVASTDSSYGQIRVANTSVAEASIGFFQGFTESTLNTNNPTATNKWAIGLGAYTGSANQFVIGNVTYAGVIQINANGKTTFGETSGVASTGRLRVGTDTSSGWGTTVKYPWIGSSGSPSLIMLQNPHVPYRTDNARSGASGRAGIRMARNSTGDWWDMGLIGDEWELYRNGTGQLLHMSNAGKMTMGLTASELRIHGTGTHTRKIVMYDGGLTNNYQFYGFGVEGSSFINNIYGTADTFYWYAGVNSTSRQLAMSLSGTGALTVKGGLTVNNTDHNYLKIEASVNKEQMVRFKNSATNYWYAGIRTSNGIESTTGFHIYSTALGDDAFALDTSGNGYFRGSVRTNNILYRTGTTGLKVGGFADANTDETGNTVVTWLRSGTWDNYLIKGSTSRGKFGTQFIGEHINSSKSWGVFSSGWDTELQVNGDGRIYMKGPVGINYTPSNNNYGPLGRKANFVVSDTATTGTNSTIVVECDDQGESSLYLCETSTSSGYGARLYYEGLGNNFFNIEIRDNSVASTPFSIDRYGRTGFSDTSPSGKVDIYNTRDEPSLIVRSSNPGSWGASLLVGSTTANGTIVDSNDRAMIVADGKYPVVNLNHTVTTNTHHGPTLQFSGNGYNSNRHWVIGTDGQMDHLDFGVSGGGTGYSSNKNPHMGISGYSGITVMRMFQNGLLVGNSLGVYPNVPTSISHQLDVRGRAQVSGTGTGTVPTLDIINSSGSTFNHSIEAIAPNMTTGQANILVVGRASSTRNSGYLGYYYSGTAGSYDNFMSIGLWGNDHLFRYYPSGDFHNHTGSILKTTYNKAYMLQSSGTSSSGSAIGFQQITAEGWSGIFVDYNPYEGWGLYHDNPSNYFYITAETNTGSLGTSFTVPNRDSGTSTAYAKIRFNQNNGNIDLGGTLTASGNVIAYSSDRRLKTNFRPIESAVEKVKALNGLIFDWNEVSEQHGFVPDRKHDDIGLIAQEVQAIVPQAVDLAPFDTEVISTPIKKGDKNAGNIEEKRSLSGQDFLTVKYEKLVPLLVEALKEQAGQIEQLTKRIEELEDGSD